MFEKIIGKSKKIFSSQQTSVLSAAFVIMFMIVLSRILGLVRQRVLAHFFEVSDISLFFAAFRLPDTLFEVLIFGSFSSAFVPVFTSLVRKDSKRAWILASSVLNLGIIVFLVLVLCFFLVAPRFYSVFAPGFSIEEQRKIVYLSRFLFLAQGIFVASYVLTGVLESLKRFLIPALAPVFYNLGIILGTIVFYSDLHLLAPVLGVVLGAMLHFLIQYPLAHSLGFSFSIRINEKKNLKKVAKLALPRIVEVSLLQISKVAELFFSSLISSASYAYYTFANTLQLLPVGLIGLSISKAALPSFSEKAGSKGEFAGLLWKTFNEMVFLILPISSLFFVLRTPLVRIVYGTDIFDWEATVQTSLVLSSFALSITFQAVNSLFSRAFYALHDTKTPVIVSIICLLFVVLLDFLFVGVLNTPVWGLALAFSLGSFLQFLLLFFFIDKKLGGGFLFINFYLLLKKLFAVLFSSLLMFFMLKFFDRSVWVKRLSFLGKSGIADRISFESFVLDTRYTFNLLVLVVIVSFVGIFSYIAFSFFIGNKEVYTFYDLLKNRLLVFRKGRVSQVKLGGESVSIPGEGETL